ncbi:MAG: hypothetical protein M1818_000249 [Claussenomyces sp. TS43310]|nr:MAG: hypothetical protein M1818_000249 [Claussenomyces sp. TS43310]
MAGKRLLDVAALFNATRGVAQKTVTLRAQQFDIYSKSSSLAKAVRSQTDRITETARAASFLASRLNETAPAWASARYGRESSNGGSETADGAAASVPKEGLEQDHFYEPSEANETKDPAPTESLDITQEKPDRDPLPDGTIPPVHSDLNKPKEDHDFLSERTVEAAREPVIGHQTQDTLDPVSKGTSTIPLSSREQQPLSSDRARLLQRQYEQQIPSQPGDDAKGHTANKLSSGHDEDSFYEPSGHTSPVLSSLPRVKIPRYSENTQGNDEHVNQDGVNADTYSSSTSKEKFYAASDSLPISQAVADQEQVPEGINTDVFNSPKVAKMLGARTYGQPQNGANLKGATRAPREHSKFVEVEDQATFNVQTSEKTESEQSAAKSVTPVTIDPIQEIKDLARDIENDKADSDPAASDAASINDSSASPYQMQESSVPSSRIGRLWNYGGLAAGMFGGVISESFRRATGSGGEGSFMLSAGNMDRLVAKLSRMRGAALKLGQMMSFQDSKMLPAPIQEVLLRVQDNADYMPSFQRDKVLAANLGPDWREMFTSFEEKPIAAASIGQVHRAVLRSTGERVAVKVQYPGVADSIDSDLNNLAVLLTASRLLPTGLYLDKTIANARVELGWECDYIREAECGQRYQDLLSDETDRFIVPKSYPEASGRQVLTMEYMEGIGVTKVKDMTQEQKDWVGTQILRLCLREITEFRFMQTDPNWTNFLFNKETNKLELLDFGASREYPVEFITRYTQLLCAASKSDREAVRTLSIELGYLTGQESKAMLNAHIASVLTLAEPFLDTSPEVYDFRSQTITDRVKGLIPVMIKERLAPPPEETYSLHRKLSGAFLLCAKLGSKVRCRQLFEDSMSKAGLHEKELSRGVS